MVLVLGVLLWLAVVTAAVVPLLDEGAGPGPFAGRPPRCPGLELGVNSILPFEGASERAATIDAMRTLLRPQVVRVSLLWNRIEPAEGKFDWSVPDSIVEQLLAAGIEPLFTVIGSPPWANHVPLTTPRQYLYVPRRGPELEAWLARYKRFLAAAAERYGDAVRLWEIWNEPNLAGYWRPRPDPLAYRRVYTALRATILRADPGARVAVGGLAAFTVAFPPNIAGHVFLRKLARAHVPLEDVALHPYSTHDHAPNAHVQGQNNFDAIEAIHRQLRGEGESARVWVTEWGWSSALVGRWRQARYLRRSLAMLEHRYRFVRIATYFTDRDLPSERLFQGLLTEHLRPKPAARVFRAQASRLAAECRRRTG